METSEKIMNLRPREEAKELSRSFRFKPTNEAERIAETVAINNGTKMPKSFMKSKRSITTRLSPSMM